MVRLPLSAAVLAAVLLAAGSGNSNKLLEAELAWERGDYIAALSSYLQLLDDPEAADLLEPIALRTGELFHTIELTPDGSTPQFSPDGRHLTYEAGAGLDRRVVLLPADGSSRPSVELPGWGAAFAPDRNAVAYLRLASPSAALRLAQKELEDAATGTERLQLLGNISRMILAESRIAVRDLDTSAEMVVDTGEIGRTAVRLGTGGAVLFTGADADGILQIYLAGAGTGTTPRPLTSGEGDKTLGAVNRAGTAVLFTVRTAGGARVGRAALREGAGSFGIITLPDGGVRLARGDAPAFSADGYSLTFVTGNGSELSVMVGPSSDPASARPVRRGSDRVDAPALAPDGNRVAFQMMTREDWELYVVNRDGTGETRITREIQHDLMPQFLSADLLLATMGEARHRRSYLYDLTTGTRRRLFHNNTVRTIAPEYAWVPAPSGTRILISAERDGDTVSAERGIYLVDLPRRVTRHELRARVAANLAAEQTLRHKGHRMYEPIAEQVQAVVAEASVDRVYQYQARLFEFDSKHISRPGNRLAGEYLYETYRSFGYQPEMQWVQARAALNGRTANVLATLRGTVNPELVYVVSSHYDSVPGAPGADDDSSGTAALLETARMLAGHPQPATIIFASFTGEESGLLGSREFVRRGVAGRMPLMGALNNDMIGWANDQRLDNTIRYSNPGIRDVQHAAARRFTKLITYDALYYKGTDAAAFYEAYGDIVGGIGSYPVLGNPHYHQSHDVLETINHQLVTEVAKTTAASVMLLASSPSRLGGLKVESYSGDQATVSWNPALEKDVTGYIVAYGPPEAPEANQMHVTTPSAVVKGVAAGTAISVKAVNQRGLDGWDWARILVR